MRWLTSGVVQLNTTMSITPLDIRGTPSGLICRHACWRITYATELYREMIWSQAAKHKVLYQDNKKKHGGMPNWEKENVLRGTPKPATKRKIIRSPGTASHLQVPEVSSIALRQRTPHRQSGEERHKAHKHTYVRSRVHANAGKKRGSIEGCE